MKIIPLHSIAIAGAHCEAGQAVEVADSIAVQLIAERQATAAGEVETAAVAPTVETAALVNKPARKLKA